MSKTTELGFGYLFHYNGYTKKWECVHRDHIGNLFGTGASDANKYVATGDTPEHAASNYIKKFKVRS